MIPYRVIITPRAGHDLEAIYDHIARDSAQNAASMVTRILDELEPLKLLPHRAVVERQDRKLRHPVRSIPVPPYVIYFRVLDDDRVVRVLHVRHGARRRPRSFDQGLRLNGRVVAKAL
jgi:plasmid stabilization system protein ParE